MQSVWRFVNTGVSDAALNMAVDEAILLTHEAAGTPPTVRVYGWRTPTLSLGYAQDVSQEVDLEACQTHDVTIVRRLTGGRAVLHDQEVTYSVVMPTAPGGEYHSLTEHYRLIGMALLHALQSLGLAVQLARPQVRTMPPRSHGSPACFAALSRYELSTAGRKLVGSAQKRLHRALLQHGSIPLWLDRQRLFACLRMPSEQRLPLLQESYGSMAAVNEVALTPVNRRMLHEALRTGFAKTFDTELRASELSVEERQLAQHLLVTKYATPAWNLGGGAAWRQTQKAEATLTGSQRNGIEEIQLRPATTYD